MSPCLSVCHPQIDVNGHSLGIVAEALGGSNIGNCPHACVARPCGPLAECVPQMESYECRCSIYNERCNKAAEVPPELLPELTSSPGMHRLDNGRAALEPRQYNKGVAAAPKKLWTHKKHAAKRKNLHKHKMTTTTTTAATTTTTTTATTPTTTTTPKPTTTTTTPKPRKTTVATPLSAGAGPSNEEIEDDIIFRFVHENAAGAGGVQLGIAGAKAPLSQKRSHSTSMGKQHVSKHEHHQKPNQGFARKLSRLPTHYESFQTNPDSDILTFDDNNDWVASLQQQEYADAMATSQVVAASSSSSSSASVDRVSGDKQPDAEADVSGFVFDESLFDATDGTEDYQRKQLAQDMKRIMSNTHTHGHTHTQPEQAVPKESQDSPALYSEDYSDDDELLTPVLKVESQQPLPSVVVVAPAPNSTPQTHTDWSLLKKFDLSAEHQSQVQSVRKNFGACFAGTDSYFHYNDADTMSQVISYNIDLNLRIKTHSENGMILWTGRQGTTEQHDDYLSLGIEKG